MTSTARQLRQPPTIEAIKRVPYFADEEIGYRIKKSYIGVIGSCFQASKLLGFSYFYIQNHFIKIKVYLLERFFYSKNGRIRQK